jgi:hypothetical protein
MAAKPARALIGATTLLLLSAIVAPNGRDALALSGRRGAGGGA